MELIALKQYIDANINTKFGDDKITGLVHNEVLHVLIDSLLEIAGTGFGGDIELNDNPGVQVQPIYFMASEVGTYQYCGGMEVTALPAFIIWNGTAWTVQNLGIPQSAADASKCQGLAFSTDVAPQGKAIGDWYVFVGGGTLSWPGDAKTQSGIVYLKTITTVGSITTYYWAIDVFGGGSGTGLTPEQAAAIEKIDDIETTANDALETAEAAQTNLTTHKSESAAHAASKITSTNGNVQSDIDALQAQISANQLTFASIYGYYNFI